MVAESLSRATNSQLLTKWEHIYYLSILVTAVKFSMNIQTVNNEKIKALKVLKAWASKELVID